MQILHTDVAYGSSTEQVLDHIGSLRLHRGTKAEDEAMLSTWKQVLSLSLSLSLSVSLRPSPPSAEHVGAGNGGAGGAAERSRQAVNGWVLPPHNMIKGVS